MLGWFRKLLPREDRFFDLFERHSRTVVGGAEALQQLLGGNDID
ncbi:MAG: nuclease PIN, partial [Mesorhizobium sp.]